MHRQQQDLEICQQIITSILDMPETQQHFIDVRIQWTFILEKAPRWGRFYERMIREDDSVYEEVLEEGHLIGKARMSYDEFKQG